MRKLTETQTKTAGQVAYNTYRAERNARAYDNSPIPEWDNVAPEIQHAWCAAAKSAYHHGIACAHALPLDGNLIAVGHSAQYNCSTITLELCDDYKTTIELPVSDRFAAQIACSLYRKFRLHLFDPSISPIPEDNNGTATKQ